MYCVILIDAYFCVINVKSMVEQLFLLSKYNNYDAQISVKTCLDLRWKLKISDSVHTPS